MGNNITNSDFLHREKSEGVKSAITSLKEIVTIVTGLTITNAIVQLTVRKGEFALNNVTLQSFLLFVLLIGNIIRFYHGNIRHLDTTYTMEAGKGHVGDLKEGEGTKTALDFFVIFLQSILFAVISFMVRLPAEFFTFFAGLLVMDVIWFLGVYQFTSDQSAFMHQKKWALNNIVATFALLLGISAERILGPAYVYLLWGILMLNTLIDYLISWDFYFPNLGALE